MGDELRAVTKAYDFALWLLWFRQECSNEHRFLSIADAQEKVDAWRNHYNTGRPHSALGNIAPEAFARQASARGSCLDLAKQELVAAG